MKLFLCLIFVCISFTHANKPAACKFPFEYKGQKYSDCVGVNSNKPWCSLDSTYEGRWVYCEVVKEDKFDKLLAKQLKSDAKIQELEDKIARGGEKACHCQKELSLVAANQLRTDRLTSDHERRLKSCDERIATTTQHLLSRGKPTGTQSRIYGNKWKTHLAVDGNYNARGHIPHTCAITTRSGNKPASWWVDLQKVKEISRIRVTLRSDCCGERFKGASIKVGPSLNHLTKCGYYAGPGKTGQVVEIGCGKAGRFVLIELSSSTYLGLCEVEVLGH